MKTVTKIILSTVTVYVCYTILGESLPVANSPLSKDEPYVVEIVNETSPPSIQMSYYIRKYAKQYNIPTNYAFGIAYAETRYQGPFHWKYNPRQISCVGALGPMQIMPSTGECMWRGKTVTREMLLNDIEFNVHTSMKLLKKLYDRYGDWKIVFGCYNTGRPCVNDYAIKVYNFSPEKLSV